MGADEQHGERGIEAGGQPEFEQRRARRQQAEGQHAGERPSQRARRRPRRDEGEPDDEEALRGQEAAETAWPRRARPAGRAPRCRAAPGRAGRRAGRARTRRRRHAVGPEHGPEEHVREREAAWSCGWPGRPSGAERSSSSQAVETAGNARRDAASSMRQASGAGGCRGRGQRLKPRGDEPPRRRRRPVGPAGARCSPAAGCRAGRS